MCGAVEQIPVDADLGNEIIYSRRCRATQCCLQPRERRAGALTLGQIVWLPFLSNPSEVLVRTAASACKKRKIYVKILISGGCFVSTHPGRK